MFPQIITRCKYVLQQITRKVKVDHGSSNHVNWLRMSNERISLYKSETNKLLVDGHIPTHI